MKYLTDFRETVETGMDPRLTDRDNKACNKTVEHKPASLVITLLEDFKAT